MIQPTSPTRRRRLARGITLAESMIASVVLAVAVVGTVAPLCVSQQQATATRQMATALSLAEQLMEEIAARPFGDPDDGDTTLGPPTNEQGRANYDDLFDYHKYHDTTDGITTLARQQVTALQGEFYQRDVAVEYRRTPSSIGSSGDDFALVTVTVTTPNNQPVVLSRLFARTNLTR